MYRVTPGYRRLVHYIESSPADQLQPKHSERVYAKPGDVLDTQQPVIFDGRNIFEPEQVEAAGIAYYGIGRGRSVDKPSVAAAARSERAQSGAAVA